MCCTKEMPLPTVHSHVAVYKGRHHSPWPMVFRPMLGLEARWCGRCGSISKWSGNGYQGWPSTEEPDRRAL